MAEYLSQEVNLRTFLMATVAVLLLAVAIYFVALPPEPALSIIHIAAHGQVQHHSPLLIARDSGDHTTPLTADELLQTLRLGDTQLAVLAACSSAESMSRSDFIAAVELSERFYVDELIRTDDENEREHLVNLIRATRSYRLGLDPIVRPLSSTVVQAAGASSTASPKRDVLRSDEQWLRDAPLLDSKKEAAALAALLRSQQLTVRERLERAREHLYHDLVEQPDKLLFPLLYGLLYFLVIVAGIYTGSIYEALGKMDGTKKIRFRQVIRKAGTPSTWQGILASPIVFAVVIVLVPKDGFSFPMAFLAYQNGFFWRATLQKFAEAREIRQEAKAAKA